MNRKNFKKKYKKHAKKLSEKLKLADIFYKLDQANNWDLQVLRISN